MTKATKSARAIRDVLILFGSDLRSWNGGSHAVFGRQVIAAVVDLPDEAILKLQPRLERLIDKLDEIRNA